MTLGTFLVSINTSKGNWFGPKNYKAQFICHMNFHFNVFCDYYEPPPTSNRSGFQIGKLVLFDSKRVDVWDDEESKGHDKDDQTGAGLWFACLGQN